MFAHRFLDDQLDVFEPWIVGEPGARSPSTASTSSIARFSTSGLVASAYQSHAMDAEVVSWPAINNVAASSRISASLIGGSP